MINIIFSEEYKNHDTGNHPESIKRIEVVNNLIKEEYSKHNLIEPSIADKKIISLVHDINYVNYIFDLFLLLVLIILILIQLLVQIV